MSELTDKLTAAGLQHQGTDLGKLLQWALLHIQSQDEALAEVREELASEESERIRLERVLHEAKQCAESTVAALSPGLVPHVQLAHDHAPHINIMAHHGVMPYARAKGRPKSAN
jgi:UDP-N-acetylmuramoylalanine-D-glutamate ligase